MDCDLELTGVSYFCGIRSLPVRYFAVALRYLCSHATHVEQEKGQGKTGMPGDCEMRSYISILSCASKANFRAQQLHDVSPEA